MFFLLSLTVFHRLRRATRAMSKVMVKFRRYHSLDIKENKRVHFSLKEDLICKPRSQNTEQLLVIKIAIN